MFAEWYAEAQRITDQTGDDEAADVLNFLQIHTILAEPRADGAFVTLEESVTPTWVACLPLLSEDAQLCPAWRREMEEGFSASFRPDFRAIMFQGHVGFSPTWRGIMFLHEGHHAMTYTRTPYNWRSARVYTERERDTHAFQNRLVGKIGGPRYQELLDTQVARLLRAEPTTWAQYSCEVDEIFGPPTSEREMGIRQAHWIIHAGFLAIQRTESNEYAVLNRQTDFLYTLYQQGGILDGKEP